MSSMANHAAKAYNRVGITTDVPSASPHKLILMLFDGALHSIRSARMQIQHRNIAAKAENISKAIAIIGELNDSLNHDEGGEIAANLASLYDYMARRLVEANLKNQVEPLNEVDQLLSGLKEAWVTIGGQQNPARKSSTEEASQQTSIVGTRVVPSTLDKPVKG